VWQRRTDQEAIQGTIAPEMCPERFHAVLDEYKADVARVKPFTNCAGICFPSLRQHDFAQKVNMRSIRKSA
jgi:hypothetical protein